MALSALRYGLKRALVTNLEKKLNLAKNQEAKVMENFCKALYPSSTVLNQIPNVNYVSLRNYSNKHVKYRAEKKYKSDSDSDSDLETLGHRGETDFWRRKMRTLHGILDVNKDSVISYDDFQLLANRFIDLGHLSEKHSNEFRNIIRNLWEKQWGEITPYNLVTVEQYLEDMHHVVNDKSLVKRVDSFLPYFFKAVDKDKSGEITVEEFKLFFECLGLPYEDAIFTFRTVDTNGDGKLSLKEFVSHGKDFLLNEDEENISKYFWGPLVPEH